MNRAIEAAAIIALGAAVLAFALAHLIPAAHQLGEALNHLAAIPPR